MPDQDYYAQTDGSRSDKTQRVHDAVAIRRLQLKLDNATGDQRYLLRGDFLHADSDSTGKVTIKLNNPTEDPIPFGAKATLEGLPIKEVFISWTAQAGLIVNLWFGYHARFRDS